MANLTPADFVLVPFIPFAIIWKPSTRLNDMLQKIQYFILLFLYYGVFSIGSIIMTPLAYVKAVFIKLYYLCSLSQTNKKAFVNLAILLMYIVLGPVILAVNFLADSIYFWSFNLNDKLHSNEVTRQDYCMTFDSFREVMYICQRFLTDKINSIEVEDMLRLFRRKMMIQAHIQFLIFN